MELQTFKYSAFISYRHLDEKEAKWIHKTLERYRLPAKVCKEYGLHKKLKQCFRDANGLAKSGLQQAILEEMQQCKYMVLVCSPNVLLDSAHIDDEVTMFQQICQARGVKAEEYIIPVIIDGSPDDPDPNRRCFPPAIAESEYEYLGFNFNERGGKTKAMLRVIATILGISADTLIMREQKRQRQQYALFGAALACLVAVVAGFTWHYMPHRAYYVDYVVQYGVPVGVGDALTNGQRRNKAEYFEITTQNVFEGINFLSTYKQYQVQYINARGAVVAFEFGNYTADKVVNAIYSFLPSDEYKVEYFSTSDKARVTFKYSGGQAVADLKNPYDLSVPITLFADSETTELGLTEEPSTKSEISRYRYEYTAGYVTKILYKRDSFDTAAADANGIYGKEYELDPATGQIIAEYYLNADDERMVLPNGLYVKRYTYDENHLMIQSETQNADGESIYVDGQPPICQFTYDAQMNLVQISYMDVDGNLALNEDDVAVYVIEYQDATSWKTLLSNKGPVVSLVSYYGTAGEAVFSGGGYAAVKLVYDANGNVIEYSYYGTDGALVLCSNGYATMKRTCDERGNVIEVSCYDTDETLLISNAGCATMKRVFDESGNLIEVSYYDVDNALVIGDGGYAINKAVYDERGNSIELSYYDTDGALVIIEEGYAIYKKAYDERGNVIEISCYGTDGALVISDNGYAAFKVVYDERGNIIELSHYGTDGALMISKYGFATIKWVFDERGNVIEVSYYDTDGTLMIIE